MKLAPGAHYITMKESFSAHDSPSLWVLKWSTSNTVNFTRFADMGCITDFKVYWTEEQEMFLVPWKIQKRNNSDVSAPTLIGTQGALLRQRTKV